MSPKHSIYRTSTKSIMASTPLTRINTRVRSVSPRAEPPTARAEIARRRSPRRRENGGTEISLPKSKATRSEDLDDQMANHSRPHIHTMARYFRAQADKKWVMACATRLRGNDRSIARYKMLTIASDRHIHHINASAIAFVQCLAKTKLDNVVTWQFSADSEHVINVGHLKRALQKQSPAHWLRLMTFACSIGLPMHKLIDTVDVFKRWQMGGFKKIESDGKLIKLALRPRFKIESLGADVECRQLVEAYKDEQSVFKVCGLAENAYERKYMYPTVAEIRHMFDRLMANLARWLTPPKPRIKPKMTLGMI